MPKYHAKPADLYIPADESRKVPYGFELVSVSWSKTKMWHKVIYC